MFADYVSQLLVVQHRRPIARTILDIAYLESGRVWAIDDALGLCGKLSVRHLVYEPPTNPFGVCSTYCPSLDQSTSASLCMLQGFKSRSFLSKSPPTMFEVEAEAVLCCPGNGNEVWQRLPAAAAAFRTYNNDNLKCMNQNNDYLSSSDNSNR